MSEHEGATPVSWLLVERGWDVRDRDGERVGSVDEVVGDTGRDIFSGLSISGGLLSAPKFVPAERISAISEGHVQVDLTKDEVHALGRYDEPPPSEQILAP